MRQYMSLFVVLFIGATGSQTNGAVHVVAEGHSLWLVFRKKSKTGRRSDWVGCRLNKRHDAYSLICFKNSPPPPFRRQRKSPPSKGRQPFNYFWLRYMLFLDYYQLLEVIIRSQVHLTVYRREKCWRRCSIFGR